MDLERKIIDYDVLVFQNIGAITSTMKKLLVDGYVPMGGLMYMGTNFYQVVVKYEEQPQVQAVN